MDQIQIINVMFQLIRFPIVSHSEATVGWAVAQGWSLPWLHVASGFHSSSSARKETKQVLWTGDQMDSSRPEQCWVVSYRLDFISWDLVEAVFSLLFPSSLPRNLTPVTQLYVSVDASTKDSLKKIDRPLFKDFWQRFLDSLKALAAKVRVLTSS